MSIKPLIHQGYNVECRSTSGGKINRGAQEGRDAVGLEAREGLEMGRRLQGVHERFFHRSNPSITPLKLENRRTEERLRQVDNQEPGNMFKGIINSIVRSLLEREKVRLELNGDKFIALDLRKVRSCFGIDISDANDVQRMAMVALLLEICKSPWKKRNAKLEAKIEQAGGLEVDLWCMQETVDDQTKQPNVEIDLQFETAKLSNWIGYITVILLRITTFDTIATMSCFFLTPNATFDDYLSRVLDNVLPQAVPGLGVSIDPLALAGRLFFTSLGLGFGALTGSVLSLTWAFIATFFRYA